MRILLSLLGNLCTRTHTHSTLVHSYTHSLNACALVHALTQHLCTCTPVPADFMGSVFSSLLPVLLKNTVDYQLWKTGAQLHYDNQGDDFDATTPQSKLLLRLHDLGSWATVDIGTMEPVDCFSISSHCSRMLRASTFIIERVLSDIGLKRMCNVLSPPGLVMEGLFWGLQTLHANEQQATVADGFSWEEVAEAQTNSQRLFDRNLKTSVDPSTLVSAMGEGAPDPDLKSKHLGTKFFEWPKCHNKISRMDVTAELRHVVQGMFDKSMEGSEKVVGKEVKDTVHGKVQGQLPYQGFRVLKVPDVCICEHNHTLIQSLGAVIPPV